MIAARLHAFGKPADVLSIDPIDLPAPAEGEIRLEMLAAPINPADLNVIEGTYGMLPELPAIIGNEGAARVAAVGSGVDGVRAGDLVAPLDPGSWCSHRNVPADRAVPLPADTDPLQASMLVVNPPTAHAMLRDFVRLRHGDWVVQNAANSGVGRCVIQLARHFGWRTLNVVRRAELVDELLAIGADRVVVEETDLRKQGPSLMEGSLARLALNAVGGASALNLANALEPGGVHVTYGAMGRQPLKIPNGLVIFRDLSFRGFWLRRWFDETPAAAQLETFATLAGLLRDGKIHVPVHAAYPLGEIHAAIVEAGAEKRAGKVLLDLGTA